MQTIQSTAFRIDTRCTQTTSTTHLQAEAKVLPLKDHLELRGTQFYPLLAIPLTPSTERRQRDALANIYKRPQSQYLGTRTALFPLERSLKGADGTATFLLAKSVKPIPCPAHHTFGKSGASWAVKVDV